MPPTTQQWIAGLDQNLRVRLRELELLAPSNGDDGITVGDWTSEYMRKRTDLKERTLTKLLHART